MLIEKDKYLHLAAGAIISLIVGFLSGPIYGWLAAALAGAGKEGYDYLINLYRIHKNLPPLHDVDGYDFGFTCLGGLIGGLPVILIQGITQNV